ncbi:hypothetical protein [Xylanimonas ulmi]|uniref:Uncharacterized protein n=1 Tax=Xylanimonas ulmi TaxID=228973 RepID=A0A4Q7M5A5_9MICO|nr:hypothetical protein [Xylanibacterium ulmi]RZS61199.1 hypothetical protein EV386_1490 [Xylanibacterium ulmi]
MAITVRTPGVLVRHLSADVVELDLDARRSTHSFHSALSRMRQNLDDIPVRIFNEVPTWWDAPSDRDDVVCPEAGVRRCMHRVIIAAADAPRAATLLHHAGYSVLTLDLPQPAPVVAFDDGAAVPPGPQEADDDVPDYPPVTLPEVDLHARCAVCGFRAYVATAHSADGMTLEWCNHHFNRCVRDTDPFIVADSRHLLTATA